MGTPTAVYIWSATAERDDTVACVAVLLYAKLLKELHIRTDIPVWHIVNITDWGIGPMLG